MSLTVGVSEVQIITDRDLWNGFLARHPHGHLLQSYEWGEIHQYLGGCIYRLGVLEEGRLIGAMMFTVAPVPLPIPVLRFNWLYCCRGPVVDEPDAPALAAMIEKVHMIAQKERAVVLRLEPNVAGEESEVAPWLQAFQKLGFRTNPHAIHGRNNWVLDLRPDLTTLRARFRKAWRQNIRIAEDMGVIVREAENDADFDAYYSLLEQTSQRDSFFIQSKDVHKEILRQFSAQGDAVLFIAEHEGIPVAAKVLIRFGDWCWDMFAGMLDAMPSLPKSHILQYHSLRWAKEKGCTYFDFRTIPEILAPDQEMWGVYHYKKGFGGFVRRTMATQDFVYRPLIYNLWRSLVSLRRTIRQIRHSRKSKK